MKVEHGHGRHGHGHDQAHEPGRAHARDRHGNPRDLAAYLARLESPERRAWQKPDRVVRALGLRRGAVACDTGAGPGYFALRLARAVGPKGTVYAIDVLPGMIEVLRERARARRIANVVPILAPGGRDSLPPRRCDLVLMVNTFHHFRDGVAYLRALARRLRPGGRIVNVDFHKRELPVGPPIEHKVAEEDFRSIAARAGLRVEEEHRFLPYQYFLVLRPKRARSGSGSGSRSRPALPGAGPARKPRGRAPSR